MQTFSSPREAKEFLISRIVNEAERENQPLSEIERKMLYFTETVETLPDIYEVNDAFERDYDSAEYEEKIAALIANLRERLARENPSELKSWKTAVTILKKEDHYLLVLIGIANGTVSPISVEPKRTPFLKLLAFGLAGFVLLAFAFMVYLQLSTSH